MSEQWIAGYPPECFVAIIGLLLLLLGLSLFSISAKHPDEQQRTEDYNRLIGIENRWQDGEVSDEIYQATRAEFYSRHPNGDESY
jgi:uncharacterized membrane protein